MLLIKELKNYEAKLTELNRGINKSRIVEDFITPLSITDKATRQKKVSKYIKVLKTIINQLSLFGMYRTLYLISKDYIFLYAHGTSTRMRSYIVP